jgi:hypothetical protein
MGHGNNLSRGMRCVGTAFSYTLPTDVTFQGQFQFGGFQQVDPFAGQDELIQLNVSSFTVAAVPELRLGQC